MVEKTRLIDIYERGGTFSSVFRRIGLEKVDYNTKDLSLIRRLLSNEKARLLHVVKMKSPKSIYELAKILKRDFKSVREDIKLLDKFGFIDIISIKSGKRQMHQPRISANTLNVVIRI